MTLSTKKVPNQRMPVSDSKWSQKFCPRRSICLGHMPTHIGVLFVLASSFLIYFLDLMLRLSSVLFQTKCNYSIDAIMMLGILIGWAGLWKKSFKIFFVVLISTVFGVIFYIVGICVLTIFIFQDRNVRKLTPYQLNAYHATIAFSTISFLIHSYFAVVLWRVFEVLKGKGDL